MRNNNVADIYLSDYNIDITMDLDRERNAYQGILSAEDLFLVPKPYLSPMFRVVARPVKQSKYVLRYVSFPQDVCERRDDIAKPCFVEPGIDKVDIRPWTMILRETEDYDLLRQRRRKVELVKFGKRKKGKEYGWVVWYELDEAKVLTIIREQLESFLNIDVRAELLITKFINTMYQMYEDAN